MVTAAPDTLPAVVQDVPAATPIEGAPFVDVVWPQPPTVGNVAVIALSARHATERPLIRVIDAGGDYQPREQSFEYAGTHVLQGLYVRGVGQQLHDQPFTRVLVSNGADVAGLAVRGYEVARVADYAGFAQAEGLGSEQSTALPSLTLPTSLVFGLTSGFAGLDRIGDADGFAMSEQVTGSPGASSLWVDVRSGYRLTHAAGEAPRWQTDTAQTMRWGAMVLGFTPTTPAEIIASEWANTIAGNANTRRAVSGHDTRGRQPSLTAPYLSRCGWALLHFVGGWASLTFPEPFPNGLLSIHVNSGSGGIPVTIYPDSKHEWSGPANCIVWARYMQGAHIEDGLVWVGYEAIGW